MLPSGSVPRVKKHDSFAPTIPRPEGRPPAAASTRRCARPWAQDYQSDRHRQRGRLRCIRRLYQLCHPRKIGFPRRSLDGNYPAAIRFGAGQLAGNPFTLIVELAGASGVGPSPRS